MTDDSYPPAPVPPWIRRPSFLARYATVAALLTGHPTRPAPPAQEGTR